MQEDWPGDRSFPLAQLVRLVEQFIRSDRIDIAPALFLDDDRKRRLIVTLNMTRVVQHIWDAIRHENSVRLEPVFDRDASIPCIEPPGSTASGESEDLRDSDSRLAAAAVEQIRPAILLEHAWIA